ncbi:hypothetical protein PybrP1_005568 [[Pythium] brassicae (nom. inval.)]|nr:hypothetical protein PybrP1_005568 [[Pythium] brassicae (nom. inval.)]
MAATARRQTQQQKQLAPESPSRTPQPKPPPSSTSSVVRFLLVTTAVVLLLASYVALSSSPHSSTSPIARTSTASTSSTSSTTDNTSPTSTMALSLPKQRAVAAVLGGLVGDAATMGLHWIYDAEKLAALVAQRPGGAAEFFEPPSCEYYSYASGALSPYGDEVVPLLQHVAAHGALDPVAFGTESYLAAKAYTGRLNHIFKELVVKGDAGLQYPELASPSVDSQGAAKATVLVARYLDADTSVLLAKVREGTKVHQIGQEAEDGAVATALLLKRVVLGASVADAVAAVAVDPLVSEAARRDVQQVLDDVRAQTYADAVAAIAEYGKSCALPGVLKGALFVLLTAPGGYAGAVRANLAAGGDNCSRAIIIGAVAAAAAQTDSAALADAVPAEWQRKTTRFDELRALAEKLVQ